MYKPYAPVSNQPVRFSEEVKAGESKTSVFKVKADCLLDKMYVKFYNHERLLKIGLRIERYGQEMSDSLINFVGDDEYLRGDNEYFDEPLGIFLNKGDRIIVVGINEHPTDDFNTDVVLSLDYSKRMVV